MLKSLDKKIEERLAEIVKYFILILFAVTSICPFLWVILSSLKTNNEILEKPFSLPSQLKFENYVSAWVNAKIQINFLNSVFYTVLSVAIILLIGAMAAYIISRFSPSQGMYTYFTAGIMIPAQAIIIPVFGMMKMLHLNNTRYGIILLYVAGQLPLAIFILYGFMKTLSKEIEEAAYMDGSSNIRTFFTIVFPLSMPGLATVGTLTFLNIWNDFLFAMITLSDYKLKTLTQGVITLQGQFIANYAPLCAGITITVIPVMIMYFFFQEQIIEGMTAGAVKG